VNVEKRPRGNPNLDKVRGQGRGRSKDPEKLSTKPEQIRRRMRRTVGTDKFQEDLELYYKHTGFKRVELWDIEELAHGKPRNRNGNFTGGRPRWLSPEIIREARRRLIDETQALIGEQATLAIQTIVKLIESEEVDDKGRPIVDARTKLDAAKFILEHIKGKATAIVEVEAVDFTKRMLASAIVLDDGKPQDELIVLEGEIVEEEEEDDSTDAE